MADPVKWVLGTSTYTHLCRAGHEELPARLAPGGVAIIPDDVNREIEQGRQRVPNHDTLWTVVEAYKVLFNRDRARAALVVDDLQATGMHLSIGSGESLFTWAYEHGWLP